jgi:hypothetical protein
VVPGLRGVLRGPGSRAGPGLAARGTFPRGQALTAETAARRSPRDGSPRPDEAGHSDPTKEIHHELDPHPQAHHHPQDPGPAGPGRTAPAKPLTPKVPAKPTTPKEAKPKAEGKAYVRCESPSKDEKYAVYVPARSSRSTGPRSARSPSS